MLILEDIFDQYFQWWQSAAARYLEILQHHPFFLRGFGFSLGRYLESKKVVDRVMDETWRNLRLPTSEDMTRLHERLNLLEGRLVSLQSQNWTKEVDAILENLKSLNKALEDIENQMAGASELAKVKDAMMQLDLKLSTLAEGYGRPVKESPPQGSAAGG